MIDETSKKGTEAGLSDENEDQFVLADDLYASRIEKGNTTNSESKRNSSFDIGNTINSVQYLP
jgi:hypothetical protein